MKKTDEDIDFSEEAFKKRFRSIDSSQRPNAAIEKSLQQVKNRITIYLDADIVEYFKTEAENSRLGYQTLINQALREKIENSPRSPKNDDFIEQLLQDKNALIRLKAELDAVS